LKQLTRLGNGDEKRGREGEELGV